MERMVVFSPKPRSAVRDAREPVARLRRAERGLGREIGAAVDEEIGRHDERVGARRLAREEGQEWRRVGRRAAVAQQALRRHHHLVPRDRRERARQLRIVGKPIGR